MLQIARGTNQGKFHARSVYKLIESAQLVEPVAEVNVAGRVGTPSRTQ
jgi:hypothetical protein